MKYTQIDATNSQTGQHLIERFLEDGTRFIKHVPFIPIIFDQLKKQFKDKNVEVEISSSKWIKIKRVGESQALKEAAEQAMGKKEITRGEIIIAEADMLKKAGFVVSVEEKGDEENAISI